VLCDTGILVIRMEKESQIEVEVLSFFSWVSLLLSLFHQPTDDDHKERK
jgi:hypothetical protein